MKGKQVWWRGGEGQQDVGYERSSAAQDEAQAAQHEHAGICGEIAEMRAKGRSRVVDDRLLARFWRLVGGSGIAHRALTDLPAPGRQSAIVLRRFALHAEDAAQRADQLRTGL